MTKFKKGDLVFVREIGNRENEFLCMVIHCLGEDATLSAAYFMVYSILKQEKFIVTTHFMNKIN